ncbi:hypothetical protein AUJ13_04400 [Candidatus Micrarchaeota archaeon CG1_02_49_24]|nr:MAG: hypothetical protein AUJ13_04400 [Candidatus Micrarchaeota archaeon CG1_02_49_24]
MGDLAKEIAMERIAILLDLCEQHKGNGELCKYYVGLVWKLVMRHKVKLPKKVKLRFCKHCKGYFVHGKNVRVRQNTNKKLMEYLCECGKTTYAKYGRHGDRKTCGMQHRHAVREDYYAKT